MAPGVSPVPSMATVVPGGAVAAGVGRGRWGHLLNGVGQQPVEVADLDAAQTAIECRVIGDPRQT